MENHKDVHDDHVPGADFTKGLSPVSDSNVRLLSQIIEIFT